MGRRKAGISRFNVQNTTTQDNEDEWHAFLPQYSKPKLAKSTEDNRARIFSDWNTFMSLKHPEIDCEKVWEMIIRDDYKSKIFVLDFIDNYIKLSGCSTRAWDTADTMRQKAVICISTANGIMKQLIAAAEAEIIRPQRQRNPDKAWMQLARPQGTAGARDIGPVCDSTRIATTLKDKWGLTIDSNYIKTDATAEDL